MPKFEEFNLQVNSEVKEIEFNGIKIEVKQYLPVETKAGIVNIAVKGAMLNGLVDEVLSSAYFHIFIVENYTNIVFDEGEASDALVSFDKIFSTGLLDNIIDAIPREEYNYLLDTLNIFREQVISYSGSISSVLSDNSELIKLIKETSEIKKAARPKKGSN